MTQIPEGIFKAYDIRGTYPDQLNEEMVPQIVRAFIKLLKRDFKGMRSLKVVVGRDMRLSSPAIHKEAVNAFLESGVDVIDLGLVDTPSVYFATTHYKVDGGMQITASHNPQEYNGLKFVRTTDRGFIKVGKGIGMEEIKEWAMNDSGSEFFSKGELTVIKTEELLEAEVKASAELADLEFKETLDLKPFKIVADAANAMAAVYMNVLFTHIPGEIARMNFELDGTFPSHPADPLIPENIVDIQKRVKEEKADVGLAPDGDGDRLMIIDEKGEMVKPAVITALVAKEILKKYKGEKILFDIRYIYTPKKIVEENGGEPILTRVGHALISEHMRKVDGVFAGESSGHYYFRANGYAELQMPIILFVLKVMSREGKLLSTIAKDLERGWESGEINFRVKNSAELLKILQERFTEGEVVDIDGVSIHMPDWRFNLRTSNTEPILRLNVEALDPELGERKKQEVIKLIEEHADYE